MNPLPLRFWLVAVSLSALLAGTTGWMIGRGSARPEPLALPPLPQVPLVSDEPPAPDLDPAEASPPAPPPPVDPVPVPPPGGTLDFDAVLAELEAMDLRIVPAKFLPRLSIPVINHRQDGELTREAIELFALGEAEVAQINSALTGTVERLKQAELAELRVVEVSETEAVFHLPGLGELAQEVEAELRQEILAALGNTDGKLFLDLMDHSSQHYWDGFGRETKRISFSAVPDEHGRVSLRIRQEVQDPASGEFSHRSTTSTSRSLESLSPGGMSFGISNQRQGYLTGLLPEHLLPFFD